MPVTDTGLDSEQDFDYGDDSVPRQGYDSPVTLLPVNVLVPEEGTFCLPVVTTQARLLEIMSVIRAGAIALQKPPIGDYNIDILKAIEELNNCGALTMSCEDIADCIETSTEVQQAITNNNYIILENLKTIANSGLQYPAIDADTTTVMTSSAGIGAAKDDEIKPLINCNLDTLWAGLREMVQRLDDNARTALEFLVSKADLAERGQALVGAIPIVGSIATSLLEQLTEVAPDMLNLYESYSSISVLDEIACELFAIGCSECRYPTFDEIYLYYTALGITGLGDLENLIASLAMDLLFQSTETASHIFYHSLISVQIWTFAMGSKFYGYTGAETLNRLATLGEDSPSPDWITLCDSCNEPYRMMVWDFTTGQHGWYLDTADGTADEGVYVAGKGWRTTNNRVEIACLHDASWVFRSCGFKSTGVTITARSMSLRPTVGSTTGQANQGFSSGTGEFNNCQPTPNAGTSGFNEIQAAIQGGGATLVSYIEKIYVIYNAANAPEEATYRSSNTNCP